MVSDGHADESVDVVVVGNTFVAGVMGNEDHLMPETTHKDRGGDIPAVVEEEQHSGEDHSQSGDVAHVSPVVTVVETSILKFGDESSERIGYLVKLFLVHWRG